MKTVLIVDDSAYMRMTIANILRKNGYTILGEASNGRESVEQYLLLKPDLVTMDITMPMMNGLAALKMIIDLDNNANCIMVSALSQKWAIRESLLSGAKNFVVKPFSAEILLAAVNNALVEEPACI